MVINIKKITDKLIKFGIVSIFYFLILAIVFPFFSNKLGNTIFGVNVWVLFIGGWIIAGAIYLWGH